MVFFYILFVDLNPSDVATLVPCGQVLVDAEEEYTGEATLTLHHLTGREAHFVAQT